MTALSVPPHAEPARTGEAAAAPAAGAAVLLHARVLATDGERYGVNTPAGRHWLKPAAGCLLVPEVGDLVLMSLAAGQGYVLTVLERASQAAAALRIDGDVELQVPSGALRVRAQGGVELDAGPALRVRGESATLEAGRAALRIDELDVVGGNSHAIWQNRTDLAQQRLEIAARSETRLGHSVRQVSGHEEVSAGSMRVRTEGDWQLRASRATLSAEHRVAVDAAQVQLG